MLVKKAFLKFLLLILLASGGAGTVGAQQLKFTRINAEQGLSQGSVNYILRDSKGFMWIGTQDGLNRYNGYSITVFKHIAGDSNSISSDFIYCMYEDKQGMLWIGTKDGGLNCYNPVNGKFTNYTRSQDPNSISHNGVRSIAEDKDGILWVGTDEGLNAFDRRKGTFKRYVHNTSDPASLSNNNVWALVIDRNNNLWVGTRGGGLNLMDKKKGTFSTYKAPLHFFEDAEGNPEQLSVNNGLVRTLYEDKEGYIWVGTEAGGVGIFDPVTKKFLKVLLVSGSSNSISHNRIAGIGEDDFGVIWLATYGGGLNSYNKKTGKFTVYKYDEKDPNSISNNESRCLYIDPLNTVWIGTSGGGANAYFRGNNKFEYYKRTEDNASDFRSSYIWSLMVDSDGLLWIGTNGTGITTFNKKENKFTYQDILPEKFDNKTVFSLYQDRDGIIWAGTWGYGLVSYNKKTGAVKNYNASNSDLHDGNILCITQDRSGLLWLGTLRGGLYSLDPGTGQFMQYTLEDGLSSSDITHLYEAKDGTLWISTVGGGVCSRDPQSGKFTVYKRDAQKNSISSNTVYCVNQDKAGNLWIGTTNGLNKLDLRTYTFTVYYEKDGLPNNKIYGILIDKNDNLWMTSNKGLSRFNPKVKNVDGSAFRNYDTRDGLQGLEFNQGAWHQAKNGEMMVGGLNGFNTFFPDRIKSNEHAPPVYITSFKRFGKEEKMDTVISDVTYIELSWRDNFSFEFVALDYVSPSQNKYSYMMEGLDQEWSPPSTGRYASYTQLQGGDYVFKVKACNNDGVWNEKGAELRIRINPPFWKTNWFYAVSVLVGIGGVFGFIKYRTASIKRENKLLEAKVEERTRELAEKNRDITSSIQYAQRIQEAILPPLKQIFSHFTDSFILYRPKDIVSGDFYWFGEKNGKKIIAAVDCTGHGVPGAFMSMIGHNLLNQIIVEKGITEPASILNELHRGVQSALKQGSSVVDTSDGMDVSICTVDIEKRELQFSGAYRPLFIINYNDFEKIEGNKFPIGGSQLDADRVFTNHTRFLKKGDTIYMFSDGYADQFGGDNGKKFMVKRFNQLLVSIQDQDMAEQGRILEKTIESWRGQYEQVDDILVIGIRF
jgi:ligand-binding sensor domain-containing protein/serine phosphatase RsbU (regulator of sigma subunit)